MDMYRNALKTLNVVAHTELDDSVILSHEELAARSCLVELMANLLVELGVDIDEDLLREVLDEMDEENGE